MTQREIPTPALLVDLDAFQANLARMAGHVKQSGKLLRPHAKSHKCPEIARRQIASGAHGLCVATVAEAELLTEAGIPNLLLTSPVADPIKMARIIGTGAMVAVDHARQVEWYDQTARSAGRTVDVLVDLDVGDHRTGARSVEEAIEVAEAVDQALNLRLRGIQAYSGHGSHAGDFTERKRVSGEVFARVAAAKDAFDRSGLNAEIVSGGSTGTWDIDTQHSAWTELQAGSYALMDMDYRRVGVDFLNAMTVLATVVSANHPGFVTLDAGLKAFSTDRAYGPEAPELPGSKYRWGGDEFGYLDLPPGTTLQVGDRISLLPPHCDPTVNLYDRIYAYRGDLVEGVWAVKSLRVT